MKKLLSLALALMLVLSMASIATAEDGYVKLTWAMGTGSTAPIDTALVREALNEISREKIGVELEMQFFTDDQLQLSINSGNTFDIYFTCSWYNNTNQAVSKGLFANIDGKVQEYAPGLWNSMSEDVWKLAYASDGCLYTIPCKKDYAMMNFLTYPSEVAAELGFEIPDRIEAWDDLTDFLVAWKETMADNEYPYLCGGSARGVESSFDFIDRTSMIGCVFGTTEVVTVFEDPAVMERYRTLAKWMEMGLINPDAAQLTETAIDSKKMKIDSVQAWPGYDYSVGNGYPTAMTCYFGPHLSVDGVQGSMNALSKALENDPEKMEAALKLIELCHIDQLYADTLRYGVKGYHWDYVTEEQNPACAGGVLRTQVGNDNYTPWAFAMPANFETSIAVSQDQVDGKANPPVFEQYDMYFEEVRNNAKVSAMKGFTMNTEAWTQNLAEMSAIKDEYYKNFASGTICIDDCYDEFIAKMNAAGLQEMIADAQEQLDNWLANN